MMYRMLLSLMLLLPGLVLADAESTKPLSEVGTDSPPPSQPAVLNNVGIDQNLGAQLPLDLKFRDESGREVMLRDYFRGRPAIVTFVYYECPMLCTLTLNQLTRSLNALTESAGETFDIITISFDPRETPELAHKKKQTYLKAYRRASAADGWHFLTGPEESIAAVTKAAGFRYKWDEPSKVYAHASMIMAVSPEGKINQYFLGTDYPPTSIRAAMTDAAEGKVAKPAIEVLFYCFKYDPATGKYGLIVSRVLKVLAGLTIAAMLTLIVGMNRLNARRTRAAAPVMNSTPGEERRT